MKKKWSIAGGKILTMDAKLRVLENAVIEIEGDRIAAIREGTAADKSGLDASNALVLPGFVNGHTHTGMSLLRGVGPDLPLHRWLHEAVFPMEQKWVSPEFVYLGSKLAALEMVKGGITLTNDMYYNEFDAARAFEEVGIRGLCGQTLAEISGVQKNVDKFLEELDAFIDKMKGFRFAEAAIGPHSYYGLDPSHWEEFVKFTKKRGLLMHLHLAETKAEEEECRKLYGKSSTKFLEEKGVWTARTVVAHGCFLEPEDISILAKNNVGVVYNPESNMKLGNGICPVVDLRKAGVNVAFGTDGVASNNDLDILGEADMGAKLQCFRYSPGSFKAVDAVRMLTIEGAAALGKNKDLGSLEVGKKADIVVLDLNQPHATPLIDPYSHIIYSASKSDVKHVVVDGEVVVENGVCQTVDEAEVLLESLAFARKMF